MTRIGHLACGLLSLALLLLPGTARANRYVIVLLDASGSMAQTTNNQTRFQAAAEAAKVLVNQAAMLTDPAGANGQLLVDVFTFQNTAFTEHTNSFIPAQSTQTNANDIIDCVAGTAEARDCAAISPGLLAATHQFPVVPSGQTPLAVSLCKGLQTIVGVGVRGDVRIVEISSDGEENATLPADLCHGTLGATFNGTWPAGSWQSNVINFFMTTGSGVELHADLFELPGLMPAATDPSTSLLEQFFRSLTEVNGGNVSVFHDNEPPPVFGDVNGDRCVDISDALLVARAFGTPALGSALDLSLDGHIGFADYELVLGNMTSCGRADPFVPRQPIVCRDRTVVIDGKSIDSEATTIEARGACAIVIRNSLIVSGTNAIEIDGEAAIEVENSTFVGEHAVLNTRGAVVLSAKHSVFHGARQTRGVLEYIDRGGNTWEAPDGAPKRHERTRD